MNLRIGIAFCTLVIIGGIAYSLYYSHSHLINPSQQNPQQNLTKEELQAKLHILSEKIKSAQGNRHCQADVQCRLIGLGMQTCGYHKDYLVYSVEDAQEKILLELITEFNRTHETLSNLSLSVNKCGIPPTSVACINMECHSVENP